MDAVPFSGLAGKKNSQWVDYVYGSPFIVMSEEGADTGEA